MDSHDGQRDPDSALILDGIRALHNRLDEFEHRVSPAGHSDPAGQGGPGGRTGPRGLGFIPAWKRRTEGEARWQVAVAVAVAVALQYPLPGRLVLLHPVWLLPTLEGLLLVTLIMANPRRINRESRAIRLLSLTLAALLSLANAWSVARLVIGLVNDGTEGKPPGSCWSSAASSGSPTSSSSPCGTGSSTAAARWPGPTPTACTPTSCSRR